MTRDINTRKRRVWDRHRLHCNYCGADSWVWTWLLKLYFIFKDTKYYTCPVCHHTNAIKGYFHVVHDSTDPLERERNRNKMWDNRMR